MEVTFLEAHDDLVVRGGSRALTRFEEWKTDDRYREQVVPFVRNFAHRHLFAITRRDFDRVRTIYESRDDEHALSGLKSTDNIAQTKNLNMPFAFSHLFHKYVEDVAKLPTWLEWRAWLETDARALFIAPALRKLEYDSLSVNGKIRITKGLRWRLGLSYLSCLRELDVLIRLRDEYGITAKYHILGDVLFRADYWVGAKTMSLFINNKEMKSVDQGGRKIRPSAYLPSPPFIHGEAIMEKQHRYGVLHLASDRTVRNIATALR